jgi:hypothetical protein
MGLTFWSMVLIASSDVIQVSQESAERILSDSGTWNTENQDAGVYITSTPPHQQMVLSQSYEIHTQESAHIQQVHREHTLSMQYATTNRHMHWV